MIRPADPNSPPPQREPRFEPGQLVQHVRYGYRGVVVDFDLSCRAPDAWYWANKTQPERDQPWYHVLVDGSAVTTYAAQTSLNVAENAAPVDHPLVGHFFDQFTGTRYVRNDQPWQG